MKTKPIRNYGNQKLGKLQNKINISPKKMSSDNDYSNKGVDRGFSDRLDSINSNDQNQKINNIDNNEIKDYRKIYGRIDEIKPYEGIQSSENYKLVPSNVDNVIPASDKIKEANSEIRFNTLWNDVNSAQSSGEPTSNDNFPENYYTARLQPPRSAARDLINREPSKFLPKKPPFSKIIDDPNLNVNDKLRILEVLDPHNENSERKLSQLRKEVEHSFIFHVTPFPLPYESVQDNTKKKRSFLFYDDMEMRDNSDDNDNDYKFDKNEQKRSPHISKEIVEEDVQPCSSCGGKGKKPNSKTESLHIMDPVRHIDEDDLPCSSCGGKGKKTHGKTETFDNACRCRSQRTKCSCASSKVVRSVSDTWYSVFNMSAPLPFLTTKVSIFRKRHDIWWKIAPSITLSSLSGIFANANLSILFSSHVDIFQLEKSLRLQNHQLLIPKDDRPIRENTYSKKSVKKSENGENILSDYEIPNLKTLNLNPNTILAVDSSKYKLNPLQTLTSEAGPHKREYVKLTEDERKRICKRNLIIKPKVTFNVMASDTDRKSVGYQRYARSPTEDGIQTIAELGYFPATMNILERCPYDKNRLCLNMLDDKVPAYSIKVKMPFRENAIIHKTIFKVKIARVITDATTKDALQVSVDLINEGLEAREFSICVCNCPIACATAAKTTVKKFLVPHFGETITFLLPLIMESNQKHKKFNCEVIVKTVVHNATCNLNRTESTTNTTLASKRAAENPRDKGESKKIVAIRPMTVDPEGRCFCVWDCNCHCIPKLETHVDFQVCKKLTYQEQKEAGLLLHCPAGENTPETCLNDDDEDTIEHTKSESLKASFGSYDFLKNAFILLIIMLILGLIKAVTGRLCSTTIDKCGYSYVQPGKGYDNSSKCRRLFVNIFFFIVFPFLFWCKCFTPSEEDLLVASTEWQCSVVQDSLHNMDKSERCTGGTTGDGTADDEVVVLSQHIDRHSTSSKTENRLVGGQDVFDMENRLTNLTMAFHEGVFDDEDDEDEEVNTKFILQALVESRESLKKLLRNHSSSQMEYSLEDSSKLKQASDLVSALKSSQIVYRTFDRPIGNMCNIPFGMNYCIQGYFLPSLGAEYEFVNYHPLAQHRCLSPNGEDMELVRPPVILCPKEFSRTYANQIEVLEAADLSVRPPDNAPCINISTMAAVASSVAKLASDQDFRVSLNLRDGDRSNTSNYSYPVHTFYLPLGEEEEVETEENATTSHEPNYYCSIDINDQIDDETQDIVDDTTRSGITNFKFDTILE